MKLNIITTLFLLSLSALGYAEPAANIVPEADVIASTPSSSVATSQDEAQAPFQPYTKIIEFAAVKDLAVIPRRVDVLIVDSRPARKFDVGHIPVAINISQSQFEQHIDLLPKDKNTQIVFYCGGLDCPLSHKSARQAETLGYKNIQVYAAGYPDWVKNGGYPGVSAIYVKAALQKGQATIVDARPPRKYKAGHVDGAINVPETRFDTMSQKLPTDKASELIFYCGGYDCPLSYKAADKARALGYTNVKLYQAGYPDWKAQAK